MQFDPTAVAVIKRAAELAQRRQGASVELTDVLHATLSRRPTPGLVEALYRAGSVAEDRGHDFVGTIHVLAAVLQAGHDLAYQAIADTSDVERVADRVDRLISRLSDPSDPDSEGS